MERERAMVLNIWDWIGVREIEVSVWGVVEVREICGDEDGDGSDGVREVAAWFWTSSLRTRPSLPVPVTWLMSILRSFKSPRTAGVANELCLPLVSTFGVTSGSVCSCNSD